MTIKNILTYLKEHTDIVPVTIGEVHRNIIHDSCYIVDIKTIKDGIFGLNEAQMHNALHTSKTTIIRYTHSAGHLYIMVDNLMARTLNVTSFKDKKDEDRTYNVYSYNLESAYKVFYYNMSEENASEAIPERGINILFNSIVEHDENILNQIKEKVNIRLSEQFINPNDYNISYSVNASITITKK